MDLNELKGEKQLESLKRLVLNCKTEKSFHEIGSFSTFFSKLDIYS